MPDNPLRFGSVVLMASSLSHAMAGGGLVCIPKPREFDVATDRIIGASGDIMRIVSSGSRGWDFTGTWTIPDVDSFADVLEGLRYNTVASLYYYGNVLTTKAMLTNYVIGSSIYMKLLSGLNRYNFTATLTFVEVE